MKNKNLDSLFRQAVDAIDTGNTVALEQLLNAHPELVSKRRETRKAGYFERPYLLWFIANNPVREQTLPANIVQIARLLINAVKQHAPESSQEQLNYTLGLVATGRIPREWGVQIPLMELLIDKGAIPGNGQDALAHGNIEAAEYLIKKNGRISLAAAVALGRMNDVQGLLKETTSSEMQVALMAAALYGKTEMINVLLEAGADVNGYIEEGFHSHASPLHQAVSSGSLDAVKILVQAGADLQSKDRVYMGTPLDWAKHMQINEKDETVKKRYIEIESFLLRAEKQ